MPLWSHRLAQLSAACYARPMTKKPRDEAQKPKSEEKEQAEATVRPKPEVGGRDGPEPTRYGDWEVGGICTDF